MESREREDETFSPKINTGILQSDSRFMKKAQIEYESFMNQYTYKRTRENIIKRYSDKGPTNTMPPKNFILPERTSIKISLINNAKKYQRSKNFYERNQRNVKNISRLRNTCRVSEFFDGENEKQKGLGAFVNSSSKTFSGGMAPKNRKISFVDVVRGVVND